MTNPEPMTAEEIAEADSLLNQRWGRLIAAVNESQSDSVVLTMRLIATIRARDAEIKWLREQINHRRDAAKDSRPF